MEVGHSMAFIVCIHEGSFTITRGKKASTRCETGKKESSVRLLIDELIYIIVCIC